jgi:hypothetical protein
MPIEWVELSIAVERLERDWGIPRKIAEEIVRNALRIGKVQVRGVARYELVPQIITEKIGPALDRNYLSSQDWDQIEIDWKALLAHGRKLIPSWIKVNRAERKTRTRAGSGRQKTRPTRPSYKRERALQAIQALWPNGIPSQSILANGPLCKKVTEWIENDSKQRNIQQLTISDDTILRAARRLS